MTQDRRKIDIALIVKTKDADGKPYTRTAPDGRIVPDPLLFTSNFGVPDDVEIRVSLWDLDSENLFPLMSGQPTEDQHRAFFELQHGRMQQMSSQGHVDLQIRQHEDRRQIAALKAQIADGGTPSND